MSKSTYWWAELDPSEIARSLITSHDAWNRYGTNPISQAWYRNTVAYYSAILEPNDWQSALGYQGEQGELIKCILPQARSLVRQIVTLVTKSRLYFKGIADSSGSDITEDMRIANAKLDEIVEDQHLDNVAELLAEHACVLGMGIAHITWRTDKGTPYMAIPDEGGIMGRSEWDGDIQINNLTVFDVNFDARITDKKNLNWIEVRTLKNRYDLIAEFPEMQDAILNIPPASSDDTRSTEQGGPSDDDLIHVYEAYHKPTPAMPEGRMVMYASDTVIFHDGPNDYGCLPVVFIIPEMVHQTGYGYPMLSNLLPAQEMFDHCVSAISTNQGALAVQSILCPRGADIAATEIGGLNYIYFTPQNAEGGGKPEPMQLTQSAPETFKFAEFLDKYMTGISGLNSTIRGQPPAGLTSGTAIATMSANALEFINSLAKSLDLGLEDIMDKAMRFYGTFAVIPRKIAIKGRSGTSSMKEYTGENLRVFSKIKIQRQNPIMNTLAGRIDTAEKLLQSGLVTTPEMYFSVLEGAPKEVLYEKELSQNDLIESENEALLEGRPAPVLAIDNHPKHIQGHSKLLNNPAVRADAEYAEAVMNHILEHLQLAQNTDPMLMAMAATGQMPQMPQPQIAAMPGADKPMAQPEGQPPKNIAKPTPDQIAQERPV